MAISAYIGIGANLGDARAMVEYAIEKLRSKRRREKLLQFF